MSNKTDYCTASPDEIFGIYLGDFCKAHDEHYRDHEVSREEADIQLRKNIVAVGGIKMFIVGWVYYFFVRCFGWMFW